MKSKVFILLMLCFGLLSCKKDKLTGDYEVLEGRWVWVESLKLRSPGLYEVLTPDKEGFNATICFMEKGRVEVLRDEEIEYKGRTDIYGWSESNNAFRSIKFAIDIRTIYRKNYNMQGLLSLTGDTMYLGDYPFTSAELSSGWRNMWVREQ